MVGEAGPSKAGMPEPPTSKTPVSKPPASKPAAAAAEAPISKASASKPPTTKVDEHPASTFGDEQTVTFLDHIPPEIRYVYSRSRIAHELSSWLLLTLYSSAQDADLWLRSRGRKADRAENHRLEAGHAARGGASREPPQPEPSGRGLGQEREEVDPCSTISHGHLACKQAGMRLLPVVVENDGVLTTSRFMQKPLKLSTA